MSCAGPPCGWWIQVEQQMSHMLISAGLLWVVRRSGLPEVTSKGMENGEIVLWEELAAVPCWVICKFPILTGWAHQHFWKLFLLLSFAVIKRWLFGKSHILSKAIGNLTTAQNADPPKNQEAVFKVSPFQYKNPDTSSCALHSGKDGTCKIP